jgi:hypothetical protein
MQLNHKLIYKSGVEYYLHLNNYKHGDAANTDKLNIVRISTSGNYAPKWMTK